MSKLLFVNFNQLRSFYAVAQEMSFTRAARMLNIGQPTLTVQVKALEKTYNAELFSRSPRGIELTDTGAALFRIARQIFHLEEEAVDILTAARDELTGRLRVGTVGPTFVMKLLSAFTSRYPRVQFSLTSDNSDAIVQRVLEFDLDVGVVGSRPDDPRLTSMRLSSHEIVLFVHADHPWAERGAVMLAELADQRLINREPGSMTRRALEEVLFAADVRPRVVMEVTRDAVHEAVKQGLGIGICAELEFRPDPFLRMVRIADKKAFTHSDLIYLRARSDKRQLQAFLGCARYVTGATDRDAGGAEKT